MKNINKFVKILFLSVISTNIYAQKSYHPDSINVINYDIHLTIVDFTNKTISGYTDVKLCPKTNNLHNVYLDLLSFVIDSIKINNNLQSTWNYNDTLLTIPLIQPANISDTLTVSVFYNGYPQEDPGANHWGGFKWSGNSAYNLGVGFEAIPHNFGRAWFPCNDNFVDRATYNFWIKVSKTLQHVAVCNGTLLGIDSINAGIGLTEYRWKLSNEIPTYLASVAVNKYSLVADTFNSILGQIPIQLWVRTSDTLKAKNTFVNLKNILSLFENKFGPYRWERVGYVGVDFNAGAMEHATTVAFPNLCITGTTAYEELYTHELSHSWFGNLITCSTAQDMWINEGWATFCEMVYEEAFIGHSTFITNKRIKLNKVLRYNQVEEGGYVTLNQVPDSITYGSTAYDKGGLVVQTLRSYLGDSLFYACVKDMLDTFKFKDISSGQMRDYLSSRSGVDLTGFFNNWVFTPGFPHFSVDSFEVVSNTPNYDVTVYAREKLRGRSAYSYNNLLEITFMDSLWNKTSEIIEISGGTGMATFSIPFNPVCVFMDLYEKTDDATSDIYKTIKNTGSLTFDQTYFSGNVTSVPDSAFIRVEHNWVAPDDFITHIPGVLISRERYWKIDGIIPSSLVMTGKFYYNKTTTASGYLDNQLITNVADSLVLLYRKGTWDDWKIIPHTLIGNDYNGYIKIDTVKKGEYTLGIRDWQIYNSTGMLYMNINNEIKIIPNPANKSCIVKYDSKNGDHLNLINSNGQVVKTINIINSNDEVNLSLSNINQGLYFVQINRKNGQSITSRMIVE